MWRYSSPHPSASCRPSSEGRGDTPLHIFQLSVVPLFLAEVSGLGTAHLLPAQLVLQVMTLHPPFLDARVLDDLPAISLGHIEGHFQASNELSLLSLGSWPRSPDRIYFLAFRFHPNLLPHDQL